MSGPKRFPWWIYVVTLMVILALALAPMVSTMVAGSIADAHGCQLDEGSIHPCVIDGVDQGEALYDYAMMGWFMLLSIPGGFCLLVLWLVVLLVHRAYWGRKQEPAR